jgi:hypothetical protein
MSYGKGAPVFRFTGGPVDGKTLMCRRGPLFLRVVMNHKGEVDALDQVDDKIRSNETAYVYVAQFPSRAVFIRSSDRSKSGCWAGNEYVFCNEQPSSDILEDNEKWRAWVGENYKRIHKEQFGCDSSSS